MSKKKSWWKEIIIAVIVTLIVGSSAPWWVDWFKDPCKDLAKRKREVLTKIENLKEQRAASKDKIFNLKQFDFEINYSQAELKRIQDSLNLNLCSN